jgi:hypothetical protein
VKLRLLLGLAVLVALAGPAHARAGFSGVVVAKQPHRGILVLAGPHGVGLTVHARAAGVRLGDRVALQGTRLRDGTVEGTRIRTVSHTRLAMIRGIVVRRLARLTIVAAGRSALAVHRSAGRVARSASDHGGLRAGDVAEFRVRVEADELVENAPPVAVGQATTVRIEGTVVSVAPLVVSLEGLPITITVPAGVTLPSGLAAGRRIELTVQVGAADTFTLVAVDEVENENEPPAAEEVELKGFVVTSTAMQLVVRNGAATVTFNAPAGAALPILAPGTFVEVRGLRRNGVLTADRIRVEQDDDHSGSGHDDGGHGDGHGGDD